jgi:NAD(P)-dependent dehydrogenase (short-subunit alcohol dehydrogenase family)
MTDDRVAIVTGGSLGIGLATVQALAERGVTVVTLARDLGRLDAAIASLDPAHRERVVGIAADVSKEADAARTVRETVDRFGRLDVLVNSAGVSMNARRRLVDTTSPEWHRIIDINLTGTYLMCREALPHLQRSPDAYILNVQSTGAYRSSPGVSLYAASKFGVRALTEALIEEYRGSSLRITSVSPGPVDTNIWSHKLEPPSDEQRARMLRPADIADIFVWLLDRPRYLHIPDITVTPWIGAG